MAQSTTARASWWSITINNPTDEERELLKEENRPKFVKSVHCQDEVGENGTLHIQGAVHTGQCRFSEVKKWLTRAHIEPARNKDALLKYVSKTETAIPGSQKEYTSEYITMDKALRMIAARSIVIDFTIERTDKELDDLKRKEFWNAVNEILLENPSIVSILTNPQLERAWVKTRQTWIEILDRQTDRQEEA